MLLKTHPKAPACCRLCSPNDVGLSLSLSLSLPPPPSPNPKPRNYGFAKLECTGSRGTCCISSRCTRQPLGRTQQSASNLSDLGFRKPRRVFMRKVTLHALRGHGADSRTPGSAGKVAGSLQSYAHTRTWIPGDLRVTRREDPPPPKQQAPPARMNSWATTATRRCAALAPLRADRGRRAQVPRHVTARAPRRRRSEPP